ncbi:hypothetical protein CYMTET_16868 [Cymbomonas tetramitiformis]|uniref:Uncharacterized protein n=1 Tax=Cymbomonas tetramitiformis TaxID=36881 RepID=A0AAE0GB29_9CHLO|nr:hypothetical protein CYMTET_16868 [Cymbomonas tetramitiformis]
MHGRMKRVVAGTGPISQNPGASEEDHITVEDARQAMRMGGYFTPHEVQQIYGLGLTGEPADPRTQVEKSVQAAKKVGGVFSNMMAYLTGWRFTSACAATFLILVLMTVDDDDLNMQFMRDSRERAFLARKALLSQRIIETSPYKIEANSEANIKEIYGERCLEIAGKIEVDHNGLVAVSPPPAPPYRRPVKHHLNPALAEKFNKATHNRSDVTHSPPPPERLYWRHGTFTHKLVAYLDGAVLTRVGERDKSWAQLVDGQFRPLEGDLKRELEKVEFCKKTPGEIKKKAAALSHRVDDSMTMYHGLPVKPAQAPQSNASASSATPVAPADHNSTSVLDA